MKKSWSESLFKTLLKTKGSLSNELIPIDFIETFKKWESKYKCFNLIQSKPIKRVLCLKYNFFPLFLQLGSTKGFQRRHLGNRFD